jgi:alanyl-tRNA synthetase
MTERLYFTDAMSREFDATVISCASAGDAFEAILDRTIFYPTSGGQPFDTGELGGARVLDVRDDDEGVIHHRVDRDLTAGSVVHGRIDWARRLDHMQQHTGQHILSAAFDHLFGVRTTSFHLGAETSTIDLAREVTRNEVAAAEREANQVVWEARPVTVRFVTDEEAARLPLRKEPVKTGLLRLVDVTGFDLSACGGTHVPNAGMIGGIGIAAWERFKGASRITFVCGARLLRSHGALRDIAAAASRALSVGAGEIPAALERVQSELKDATREIRRNQEELAGFRARSLRDSATTIGPYRGVLVRQAGADATALKTMAAAIVSEPGFVAVLTGDGPPTPVVIARAADVPIDAGAWLKRATVELGGRGGGRPELAQGGLDAAPDVVLDFARRTIAASMTML